jgi:uncharacterized protein (DUF2062 family)
VTPETLAFSLSLGTAIGLIPILGVSTMPCAAMAVILKLNMSSIQLANYLLTAATHPHHPAAASR